ncbi:hypothetical protein ACJX0J_028026, partial [Zea mays]
MSASIIVLSSAAKCWQRYSSSSKEKVREAKWQYNIQEHSWIWSGHSLLLFDSIAKAPKKEKEKKGMVSKQSSDVRGSAFHYILAIFITYLDSGVYGLGLTRCGTTLCYYGSFSFLLFSFNVFLAV